MSLTITAASHIRLIDANTNQDRYVRLYLDRRTGYFKAGTPATVLVQLVTNRACANYTDNLRPGVYQVSGQYFDIRTGGYHASYTNYESWLEKLAQLALGVSRKYVLAHAAHFQTETPFGLLLTYSSVEDFIGLNHSRCIAADFAQYAKQLNQKLSCGADERWLQGYKQLWQAFTIGAAQGVVCFG